MTDASRRPKGVVVGDPESPFATASTSDEAWWLEPYPDALIGDIESGPEARYEAREAIALSFVAGLQRLPAQQRAALVLHDVLGFSAAEAADMLDSTPASVNSALQRARSGLEASRDPDHVHLPRSPHEAEVIDRFVNALQRRDRKQVVALLTDNVRMTMPPEPFEFRGPRDVANFLGELWGDDVRVVPTRANDTPAFGYYRPDPHGDLHRAGGLFVVSVLGERVSSLTRFGDKSLFATFGLPRTLTRP